MAYLETVLAEITDALGSANLTVIQEFSLRRQPIPSVDRFITVAAETLDAEAMLPFRGGTAMPGTLRLRFRLHCKTNDDPEQLQIQWQNTVLPVLLNRGYAIRSAQLCETAYSKQLDRIIREGHVILSVLLTRELIGEEAEPVWL